MSQIIIKVIDTLRETVEYLLIAISSLLLYFLLRIEFFSIALPVSGILVGAVVSLIAKRFEISSMDHTGRLADLDYRIPVVVTSLYISSIFFIYRFYTYELPVIHYVIFGAYVGFIAFEITQDQPRRRVLPQLLALCFFTYWSNQLMFPAGAFQPDTMGEYIPIIEQTIAEPAPSFDVIYQSLGALNLSFVTIFKLVSDTSAFMAYALLATLMLTGTILIIALLSRTLPSLSPQTILFAALVFGISSWMLGRGMRPNKLNFFYPLILLLGVSVLFFFDTDERLADSRWGIISLLVGIVLIFGHRYSAGAGLFMLFTISVFVLLRNHLLSAQYPNLNGAKGVGLVGAYILGVIGNPFHQGPLLGRLSDTILSLITTSSASSSSTGGPGRYSALQFDVLALSTASQILLFALVILGFCWGIRKKEWEYDYTTIWVTFISLFLVFSVVQNSVETSPQRFYSLLILFGFNVFAAVALYRRFDQITPRFRTSAVVFLVVCLSLLSLASPIASPTTGPLGDEVPHSTRYITDQSESSSEWAQKYSLDRISNLPIIQTGATTGRIDTTQLETGVYYMYSEQILTQSGGIARGGLSLGGRLFVFVTPPSRSSELVIYSNGDSYALQHR
ncbi:hypothetical protein [Haloquadratum walsbyi]|uniref:Uncharacterized protein n=1 Tax=Haloquadratum walsbyi (strain DSM 16790 / HBSQ001) TaxID=362976 RepID=Q18EI8_HALWD|nr:hypothetical protein [Haloquadratum walsbyi]CAJ53636.1 uncharacterized protein HQ_3546A [Haloquadratum walsbyi DSM 16790]